MKKKFLVGLGTGFFVCCIVGIAHATLIMQAGPGGSIDPPQSTSSTLTISGHGAINDVNVWLDVDGSYAANISAAITHNGNTVGLFTASDDEYGEYDVMFDDEASDVIDALPGTGSFQTNTGQLLGLFDGMDVYGDWTLSLWDDVMAVEDENSFEWGILASVSEDGGVPVPEPATMILFGTGLAGFAGIRMRRQKNARRR